MPRKTEMPEDVRRMTAEMRKAHDNPDPHKHQVGRRNPKAVSASEDKAMLSRLRGEPLSRREIREIVRKEGNTFDKSVSLVDAILEGLETVAAAKGPGPKVYGGSGVPVAQPEGKPLLSAGHILSGSDFMNAAKSGVLVQPSIALSRAGTGFPLSEAYAGRHGSGYPDVIIKIPEGLIKGNPKAVWSNTDLGSPTIRSIFDLVEQARDTGKLEGYHSDPMGGGVHRMNVEVPSILFSGTPGEVLSTKKGREAFHSFRDSVLKKLYPSTFAAMNPNVGELGGKPLAIMNGSHVVGDVPESFSGSIQAGEMYSSPYGEIKILGDVPLSDIWKSGNGVIIRTPRDGALDRSKVKEMIQYLRDNNVPFKTESPYNPFDKDATQRGRDNYRDIGNDFVKLVASVDDEVRAASKGGNTPGESKSSGVPSGHNTALDGYSGPRVVINPSVFKDEKDALCVSFDEAFRIIMEINGFDPVAEPTEKQRKFFSDTAYADDERMLRRTILARICTFDTSVTDPTDEQLQEAVEFLETVMEIGAPQNEWEQRAVQRIRDTIERSVGQPRAEAETPEPPAEGPAVATTGGGDSRLVRAAVYAQDEEKAERSEPDPGADVAADFQNSVNAQVEEDLAKAGAQSGQATPGASKDVRDEAPAGGPADANRIQQGTRSGKTSAADDAGKQEQEQEVLAPGLARSGSRGNILEYNGRRISSREFERIQTKFLENAQGASTSGTSTSGTSTSTPGVMPEYDAEFTAQNPAGSPESPAGSPESPAGSPGSPAGLVVSGSRNNIFTLNGRRVTKREADAYKKKNGLV